MTKSKIALRGVFPPLATPFRADGAVDEKALAANIEKYNETGVAGYVVMGSTGESVLLTEPEKGRVWGVVKQAATPEKILIAGTGCEATGETIDLTKKAAGIGYQVALVRTPSYYKPQTTEAALEAHFRAVADESPIPVLIYAVPQFTGMPVTAGLVERLAKHPNIMGIKESSGVMQLTADILRRTGADFQVVVGSATTFYPSLTLGAWGGILAVACALPERFVELYEASTSGEHEKARALQQKLHEPTVAVTSRYGVAGLKHAMELRGYAGGEPRLPLLPLNDIGKRDVERIFQAVDASN